MVNSSLNDESSTSCRNKLLEDFFEVACDLLECPFDGLILPLVEYFNEFLNRLGRLVEVFSALNELVTLLCEVVVLLKRLLVDVGELLEAFVNIVQLLYELWTKDNVRTIVPWKDH